MAIPFLNNTSFSADVTVASTLTVGGNIQGNGGIKIVGPASHILFNLRTLMF